MKYLVLAVSVMLLSCEADDRALDEQNIETTIRNLHVSLKNAYSSKALDSDSLLSIYYSPESYYVTPWGTSETIDSTKLRFKAAIPQVADYNFSIESLTARSYGTGGYAFYVLRQEYKVNGAERTEYLPTTVVLEKSGDDWKIVHAHRSTDPETWAQWFGEGK